MKYNIFNTILVLFICFTIYFYSLSKNKEDTVYFSGGLYGDLIQENSSFHNIKEILENNNLKAKNTHSFKNLKNLKYLVVFDYPREKKISRLKRIPKEKIILFSWEPPAVIEENHLKKFHGCFSKVFTFNDDLVDNKKYYKFSYPEAHKMIDNILSFNEKKLLCLVASDKYSDFKDELYSKRREAIRYFEEYAKDDFDLYGYNWNIEQYPSYKGQIQNKIAVVKRYKFSICFENNKNINGYITEKIFQCFESGNIPIYLGAENILDYIPKGCFIDFRNFKNFNELYIYLKTMEEEEYQNYLENIRNFLSSQMAKPFTSQYFQNTMKKALNLK